MQSVPLLRATAAGCQKNPLRGKEKRNDKNHDGLRHKWHSKYKIIA